MGFAVGVVTSSPPATHVEAGDDGGSIAYTGGFWGGGVSDASLFTRFWVRRMLQTAAVGKKCGSDRILSQATKTA